MENNADEKINRELLTKLAEKCKSGNHRLVFAGKSLYSVRCAQLLFMEILDFKGDIIVPDKDTCDMITTVFKYNNVLNSDNILQGATDIGVLRFKDGLMDDNVTLNYNEKQFIDIRSFRRTVDERTNCFIEATYFKGKGLNNNIINVSVKLDNDGTIEAINYYG